MSLLSYSSSNNNCNCNEVEMELQLMEAMYPHEGELNIKRDEKTQQIIISILIRPQTAMDSKLQFVQCTLVLELDSDYPETIPKISIEQEKGLSSQDVKRLISRLETKAREELIGTPMVFALVEDVQSDFTHNNTPSEDCSICLCPISSSSTSSEEEFMKTPCFHYFHRDCFQEWCKNDASAAWVDPDLLLPYARRKPSPLASSHLSKIRCPICRERIPTDWIDFFLASDSSSSSSPDSSASSSPGVSPDISATSLVEDTSLSSSHCCGAAAGGGGGSEPQPLRQQLST